MGSLGIFPDPATIYMINLIKVHNIIMIYALVIAVFVTWLILQILRRFFFLINFPRGLLDIRRRLIVFFTKEISHDPLSELVWTSVPAIILVAIAVPSFNLLYASDILGNVDMSIKIIGYQWYWKYSYTGESANWILNNSNNLENKIPNNTKNIIEFLNLDTILNEETIEKDPQDLLPDYIGNKITFNSNMLTEEALTDEDLRLLTVDNPLVLPIHTTIRLLITSHDVLHSWAVPAFGIKTDACPARLNQVFVNIFRNGVFYGQCSELCGVQHGFMPIQVIVADL